MNRLFFQEFWHCNARNGRGREGEGIGYSGGEGLKKCLERQS